MTSLALFTLSSLLLSRSAQGIPVPAPQAAVESSATAVAPSAAATLAVAATSAASGASVSPVATSAVTETSPEDATESGGLFDDEDATPSATGTSAAAAATETSESGISKLNGMSTAQLAMYVGIGFGVLVALGVAYYFYDKYKKKKKAESGEGDDDDDSDHPTKKGKRSKYDSDDDSDDESEDEKPSRAPTRPRQTQPPLMAGTYPPDQPAYRQSEFYPAHPPSSNMAGAGAHGYGYENTIRHANGMDVYPVDPSLGPSRPPLASPPINQARQKSVQRSRPAARVNDGDASSVYSSSDESDSETEEEKKRRLRKEAKKQSKKSRV